MDWGFLLLRFRNGDVTAQDIDSTNERVVGPRTVLPDNMRHATAINKDRDAINAGLFQKRCERAFRETGQVQDSVIIFSDSVEVKDGSNVFKKSNNTTRRCWENCGEDDIKFPENRERMDPVLRLHVGCRVMLTKNTNVKEGKANGTQATTEKIVLKQGEIASTTKLGGTIPIPAVKADQIDHIQLRHSSDRINPREFSSEPERFTFRATMPVPEIFGQGTKTQQSIRMRATQIPCVINNATTGHKLQGSSVDALFVHKWNYQDNWPCVMLSRVRTKNGLFCREKLKKDMRAHAMPDALKNTIRKFKRHAPSMWSDEDYFRNVGTQ